MTILRLALATVLAGALALGAAATAHASTTTEDARVLRDSVVTLTREYEREYGSRVTSPERAELAAMGAQARREMNALVRAIRRAEQTGTASDWRTARRVHTAALTTAEARFDRAAALLQPHLTLEEQVQAYTDYSRTLRDFERLGQRLPPGR